jgi:hypothetical protein
MTYVIPERGRTSSRRSRVAACRKLPKNAAGINVFDWLVLGIKGRLETRKAEHQSAGNVVQIGRS